ncbi:MAG: GTPase HflX, partial [Chlorobiales bacterium]|nr:GTPase HflX [Chlorobiales bacterium]
TNAGKSTLMNALCPEAKAYAENRLFATLDTTTRKLQLKINKQALLSDTVGFIRKLPHSLVESFKSTLDEVRESDILLHVVDLSHPGYEDQIKVVEETLVEIGATNKPTLLVFNKIDLVDPDFSFAALNEKYPGAVFVSAERGINLSALKDRIGNVMLEEFEERQVRIHVSDYKLISYLHEKTEVLEKHYDGEFVELHLRVSKKLQKMIFAMLEKPSTENA